MNNTNKHSRYMYTTIAAQKAETKQTLRQAWDTLRYFGLTFLKFVSRLIHVFSTYNIQYLILYEILVSCLYGIKCHTNNCCQMYISWLSFTPICIMLCFRDYSWPFHASTLLRTKSENHYEVRNVKINIKVKNHIKKIVQSRYLHDNKHDKVVKVGTQFGKQRQMPIVLASYWYKLR